ncbi:MAG: hypothetical protein QXW97_00260 [Candidatus Pacearchaeota archaeon]
MILSFVSADNFNVHYKVYADEGWNLLHGFGAYTLVSNFVTGGDVTNSDVVAIFAYLPIDHKYARIYPNPEVKVDDQQLLNSAFWVYLKKGGWIEYNVEQEWASVNDKKLYAGWNFVGITSDMFRLNVKEWKGNCNIEKIGGYQHNRWDVIDSTSNIDELMLADTEQDLGRGMIVKVTSNCMLSLSGSNEISPPAIPDTISNPPTTTNPPMDSNLDFPKTIGEFTLKSENSNDKTECGQLDGNNVCVQMSRIEYVTSDNRAVHVLPTKITSGKDSYINYIKTHASEINVGGVTGVYRGAEPWELYWFTNKDYDMIGTQDYTYTVQSDGSQNAQTLNGTTTSSVAQWLLNKYPPITV